MFAKEDDTEEQKMAMKVLWLGNIGIAGICDWAILGLGWKKNL